MQASAIEAGDRTGARRSCANTYVLQLNEPEFRSNSDGIRSGTPTRPCCEVWGLSLIVMQELLRHSSFRSTLDVYTQAVTPAKHAAQAAVMSLVFSSDKDGLTLGVR